MKKIVLILVILVIAVLVYLGFDSYKGEIEVPQETPQAQETSDPAIMEILEPAVEDTEDTEDTGKISVDELALHNTPDDCWVVYDGHVYDVTKFLPIHPGGVEKISPFCGVLGFQEGFEGQHGDSKVEDLKNKAGQLQGQI